MAKDYLFSCWWHISSVIVYRGFFTVASKLVPCCSMRPAVHLTEVNTTVIFTPWLLEPRWCSLTLTFDPGGEGQLPPILPLEERKGGGVPGVMRPEKAPELMYSN